VSEQDKKAITYISYLKVDELLELQQPESDGEHDEMLFIVIHQTYELWFKQMLHEIAELQRVLVAGETHRALAVLGRVRTIMKTCVGQLDILETMTPLQFNTFRGRLQSSSGFQSAQFREFEAVLVAATRLAPEPISTPEWAWPSTSYLALRLVPESNRP